MVPTNPYDALGPFGSTAESLLVDVARERHLLAAEGHEASRTRFANGYGGLWRDLLVDISEKFGSLGFRNHKINPGGYGLPIVNGNLIYTWRVPVDRDVSEFASSPTRVNAFSVPATPTLFDTEPLGAQEHIAGSIGDAPIQVLHSINGSMPLVLVMLHSTPTHLRSIEWAMARLVNGSVFLEGRKTLWQSELTSEASVESLESFDSGVPIAPQLAPREQESDLDG